MPSAMQSPVFGRKKSSTSSLNGRSAQAYLTALAEADAKSRQMSPTNGKGSTPTSTPALSFSSSITSASSEASSYASSYSHSRGKSNGGGTVAVVHQVDEDVDDGTGLTIPREAPTSEQSFTTKHSEFGHCANPQFRYYAHYKEGMSLASGTDEEPPYYILLTTYISYLFLICLGHVRDFFGKRFDKKYFAHLMVHDGYAALNSDFDSFYTRRLKARIDDCFSHPVTGVAGRTIQLLDRTTENYNYTYDYPGTTTRTLNISSYNYLGFAQSRGGCADAVEESIRRYGLSAGGSRRDAGTLDLHNQAERLVARFIGQEDSIITSMGFATNSTLIPTLVSKGCLVISDELNHASIRYGVRISGAQVRMYKHNNMEDLEKLLREVISQGQPKTHRPWKKILLIAEGLFSMEGTFCNLPALIALKKKYKFYLWVDEAHSVGAIGPHGRGVCDYFGIDPRNVDILMGTFTKSFGAAGGYIAGSKALVDAMRLQSHSHTYAESMSPPVLTQIIASMSSIMGVKNSLSHSLSSSSSSTIHANAIDNEPYTGPASSALLPPWLPLTPEMISGTEGTERLRRIAFNSRYLALGLKKLGFIIYGHLDSPVIPLLLFNPGKMPMFHRLMLERQTPITTVVVGYPATPLITSRMRFCVSASHTKADMDEVLRACDEVGDMLDLKHGLGRSERWSVERISREAVELVNA